LLVADFLMIILMRVSNKDEPQIGDSMTR